MFMSLLKRLKGTVVDEIFDFISDISRANTVLDFRPKTKIKNGLRKTIERFLG